jgi:hypothetical protein
LMLDTFVHIKTQRDSIKRALLHVDRFLEELLEEPNLPDVLHIQKLAGGSVIGYAEFNSPSDNEILGFAVDPPKRSELELQRERLLQAIRLLDKHSGGSFDPWTLSGPGNGILRKRIAELLTGQRKLYGFNKLRDEFFKQTGATGNCLRAQLDHFRGICRLMVEQNKLAVEEKRRPVTAREIFAKHEGLAYWEERYAALDVPDVIKALNEKRVRGDFEPVINAISLELNQLLYS